MDYAMLCLATAFGVVIGVFATLIIYHWAENKPHD